jgi:hypothetical protein
MNNRTSSPMKLNKVLKPGSKKLKHNLRHFLFSVRAIKKITKICVE